MEYCAVLCIHMYINRQSENRTGATDFFSRKYFTIIKTLYLLLLFPQCRLKSLQEQTLIPSHSEISTLKKLYFSTLSLFYYKTLKLLQTIELQVFFYDQHTDI